MGASALDGPSNVEVLRGSGASWSDEVAERDGAQVWRFTGTDPPPLPELDTGELFQTCKILEILNRKYLSSLSAGETKAKYLGKNCLTITVTLGSQRCPVLFSSQGREVRLTSSGDFQGRKQGRQGF